MRIKLFIIALAALFLSGCHAESHPAIQDAIRKCTQNPDGKYYFGDEIYECSYILSMSKE
jgi:PBP1b-binding outer membrane lipoprotein LpoB